MREDGTTCRLASSNRGHHSRLHRSALKDVRVLTAYLRNGFGKVRYLDVVPGLVSAVIRESFTPVPTLEKAG